MFVERACPDDVEVLVVPAHRCGVVVPEPGEPEEIFVVVVEPPVPSDAAPVLETGVDLGMTPAYGGLAPIAQRTGRRVVIVDLPGTGHSQPSLDCPEVESLGDATASDDPARLTDAVAACRARLQREGVDVAGLIPARLGEALAAVMTALDEPRWVVMGHGTTAEAGRQLALTHPERVEALVVDSLVADPGIDLDPLVIAVSDLCRAEPGCRRRYGDPEQDWRRARRDLDRRPLSVDIPHGTVRIDGATLERGVRWLTGPVEGPAALPAFLEEAATRRPGPHLQLLAATLSVAPPLCVGYVPKCETDERLVIGATLSAQCPTAAQLPGWQGVCRAWGITTDQADPTHLTGVPVLALSGRLDPFAPPELIDSHLQRLAPDAHHVELAAGGHNVLGVECTRTVRNTWLAGDLDQPPSPEPCLQDPPTFD
ncbi:alpha/beta fold hydrolase [Nocardioides taihuensis]|uniref:Alpha/beta fold hydrolase n=1 Tax=Nocardioides taihuensis TaxID=1835606 RepID=A0ABW0BQ57_9ACTN